MQPINTGFSCYIIGNESLTIQCSELLLAQNHQILGMYSKDPSVIQWCKKHSVTFFDSLEALKENASSHTFDYLFSIVNTYILPSEFLKLPQKLPINYHDAPLPRYAGSYATSWALLNQEKTHGISWHIMTESLDGGDILKQCNFDISEDDTALSLNVKCYEHAIKTFEELIEELNLNTYKRTKQNQAHRSFYALQDKPAGGGLINWNDTSTEISHLCRALNFGSYTNALASAKIIMEHELLICEKIEFLGFRTSLTPGTIVEIFDNCLQICTGSMDVLLFELIDRDGYTLSIPELVSRFGLEVGYQLPNPSQAIMNKTRKVVEDSRIFELFWVNELRNFNPCHLSFIPAHFSSTAHAAISAYTEKELTLNFSSYFFQEELKHYKTLTLILLYLYQITDNPQLGIIFSYPELKSRSDFLSWLISPEIPLNIFFDEKMDYFDSLKYTEKTIEALSLKKNHLHDLRSRYPDLKELDFAPGVSIEFCNSLTNFKPKTKSLLCFAIKINSYKVQLFINNVIFDSSEIQSVIENIGSHLNAMLRSIIENKKIKINKIPVLSDVEHKKVIYEWNYDDRNFFCQTTVHELFQEQVRQTPNKIAIRFYNKEYTYAKINELSNRLANFLISSGVTVGTLIAIYSNRSIEMLVSIIAVLKSGAAYIPIDPAYPNSRIKYILNDLDLSYILVQPPLKKRLFNHLNLINKKEARVFKLELDKEPLSTQSCDDPKSNASPDNLAYVIYTSGSTGEPKGVAVEHKNLVNFISAYVKHIKLNIEDHVLGFSSFSFDVFIGEFFGSMLVGATFHLVNKEDIIPSKPLESTLISNKITTLSLPPSVLELLTPGIYEHLKKVIVAGEACSVELANQWSQYYHFFNGYGPTEATVLCSVEKHYSGEEKMPLGYPLQNIQLYILNSNLIPVPIGVVGELYIGGAGVSRGYFNKPEITAKHFIKNPFSSQAESKMYKSGDLCRRLMNGKIEYIGRADNQVKIHGFRIELSEVELALKQHSAIQQAIVMSKIDYNNNKYLVSYLKLRDNKTTNAGEIRSFLKELLPNFMLPAAFIILKKFPLTNNGKIDYKKLPEPDYKHYCAQNKQASLSTDEEKTMADLWGGILSIDQKQISIHDNFFELGGHSLLLSKLALAIETFFLVNIKLSDLFNNPTITHQIRLIHDIRNNSKSPKMPDISALPKRKMAPVSLAQRRLWLFQGLNPDTATYNIPRLFKLTGDLNAIALEASFQKMIKQYEILRTNFCEMNEQILQIIHSAKNVNFSLNYIDAFGYSHSSIMDLIYRETHKPFKLGEDLLIKASVYKKSENEYLLYICIHHIIFDGWSFDQFYKGLSTLYKSSLLGIENSSQTPSLQYADFSCWQKKILKGHYMKKQEDYWKNKLKNIPVTELPTDFVKSTAQTYNGRQFYFDLSSQLMNDLLNIAKNTSSSLFTVLLSAFDVLIYRYNQQTDIVVGTSIANRQHEKIQDMIGFFVNTLVLRSDLSNHPTFIQLIERNKEMLLEAYSNQEYPFEHLTEVLSPPSFESIQKQPCQLSFTLNQFENEKLSLENLNISEEKLRFDTSKYDLSLVIDIDKNKPCCFIEYKTDLFDEFTIMNLSKHFECLLKSIVQSPERRIHHLRIYDTTTQPFNFLSRWNDTCIDYSIKNKLLHTLFEQQVIKTPDDTAVIFEGHEFSYRTLNERSNQLARYLQSHGVVPGDLISICVYSCVEMVVSMLAVLKTGSAYIPIDPDYPLNRIHYMIEDSGCKLILSHESLKKILESFKKSVIPIDLEIEEIKNNAIENIAITIPGNAPAYVIYTSGTTGEPKGVICTHEGICNRLTWMQNEYQLTNNDRVLQKTTFCFDVSVWEFFWPLISGAKLVLSSHGLNKNPTALIDFIENEKISIIHFVPSMLKVFLEQFKTGKKTCLKKVFSSGEKLSYQLQKQFFFVFPNAELYNLYGPTEAAVDVSHWDCRKNAPRSNIVPIGKPIANTKFYVLDPNMKLLPIGAPGELYISGIGVAKGYLNKPDLTKKKFVHNPFDNLSLLYKTGDFVRWLPDGSLEYIDRLDNQIKLRGYRIELNEIEGCILKYPVINQCVLVTDSSCESLIAYLVLNPLMSFTESEMKRFLARYLPSYMIPSSYIVLNKLPLSITGKVDRISLKNMALNHVKRFIGYSPPQNAEQSKLIETWESVLNIKQLGINDNFFDFGGHSLSALKMLTRVNTEFSVRLQIHNLFENPTIFEFDYLIKQMSFEDSFILNQKNAFSSSSPIVPLRKSGNKPPLFLFHPIGGTTFCYLKLSNHIQKNRPVYALQDPSINVTNLSTKKSDLLFNSVEKMVAHYLDEIRKVQAYGPYLLAGFSSGATAAVEATRQLQQQGEQVSFLCSIDGWSHYPDELDHKEYFQANMRRIFEETRAEFLAKGIVTADSLLELQWQRAKMHSKYKFRKINQKLILFKSKELLPMYSYNDDPSNHWNLLANKGIDIHLVPGTHESMLQEPYVRILADGINYYLELLDQEFNVPEYRVAEETIPYTTWV